MNDIKKQYEASLKSIETENKIDRIFYRPIGFAFAKLLTPTGITPNTITIISIFVGAAAGYMFYFPGIKSALIGILFLMCANILDCVDGQLARLTGIKSEIGRILDGLAGDIWFTTIYVAFALRLGGGWLFVPAVVSGLSHLVQANITDYYKTLHLYFISKEKGSEFQSLDQVEELYKAMKPGINKLFYFFYRSYTALQVKATPKLQTLLKILHQRYGDDIPDDIRLEFRKKSRQLMRYIDLLTFNGRTIVMFIVVLTGKVWLYFLYEIVILNLVLAFVIKKHEKMCATFIAEIEG